MIARHLLGPVDQCRLSLALLALLAALLFLSPPALRGDDKTDAKKEEISRIAREFKSFTTSGKTSAIKQLAQLGEGAARPLCDAMLDRNDKIATAALVALESAHPTLYKPVAKLVLDADLKNQAKALEDLAAMGTAAQPALGLLAARSRSALTRAENDKQSLNVVKAYAKAISAIGAEEPETVEFFKVAAESPLVPANAEALKWLAAWAGDQESRRKELLPCLKKGIGLMGADAIPFIAAAGRYGGLSKDLLPELKKLKLSKMAAVRDAATEAVNAIEG